MSDSDKKLASLKSSFFLADLESMLGRNFLRTFCMAFSDLTEMSVSDFFEVLCGLFLRRLLKSGDLKECWGLLGKAGAVMLLGSS